MKPTSLEWANNEPLTGTDRISRQGFLICDAWFFDVKENESQIEKLEPTSDQLSVDSAVEPFVIDKQAASNLWDFFEILRRWAEEEEKNG